jgi:hypothetical protein
MILVPIEEEDDQENLKEVEVPPEAMTLQAV